VFEASHPFALFDYFRIPYQVRSGHQALTVPVPAGLHRIRVTGQTGPARYLFWPDTQARRTSGPASGLASGLASGALGRHEVQGCTFFGHIVSAIPAGAQRLGDQWHPAEPVLNAAGLRVAAIWRDSNGSIFLPFDPGEVMHQYWSEQYLRLGRSAARAAARSALLGTYYRTRPAIPRSVQLRLRRRFVAVQTRSSFPAWPVEDSLHELYDWLINLISGFAGMPVPFIDLWPSGRSWALVLTHDVETGAGRDDISLLREAERELGYRSSWNFVGQRYPVSADLIQALKDEGCEIGVHGLRHDGRDLRSRRTVRKRLPAMREFARQWQAVGFRSPSTQRAWELMPLLGFEYDSSYSDTDPYEPQPGGCCTYLPFFNQNLVELPITLPQDHTLFSILADQGADVWLTKTHHLRERRGLALVHGPAAAHGRVRLATANQPYSG
jgi:hypothetical protein